LGFSDGVLLDKPFHFCGVMNRAAVTGTLIVLTSLYGAPGMPSGTHGEVGAIEGRITFGGTPPPPTIVIQDGGSQQVLYVDRSGGLRYVVVFLTDAAPTRARASLPAAIMDQRNFIFEPQVLAVHDGQLVRFTSDDPANHNVRAQDPNPANTFSISTGSGSVGPHAHQMAATPADRPLALSCDIHPWMAAWVYVFDHDEFAVTKADGSFRIPSVPTGRHRVSIRQPSGGLARDLTLDVRPSETVHVDVRFTPEDVARRER
jgi:plastocyanin